MSEIAVIESVVSECTYMLAYSKLAMISEGCSQDSLCPSSFLPHKNYNNAALELVIQMKTVLIKKKNVVPITQT